MRISKNFSLSEMVKSATAVRLNVDNSPNSVHLVNVQQQINVDVNN